MNRDQLKKLERDLWSAADKLRANSDLKASEYSTPVLGLIFLKFPTNVGIDICRRSTKFPAAFANNTKSGGSRMDNVFWGVHGAVSKAANPAALLIGDSWFWYPKDNLALELGSAFAEQQFVVVGQNGAEAAQWSEKYRKDIDFGFKMYGSVQALMLSGGGNDIAGMSDFLRLLQDNCSKAESVDDCYRQGQPDAIIAKIIGAYREVTLRFRAYNALATVFMHNYDNAWPTGKGFFGPADWLKMPMGKARVPKDLRRLLFKNLVDRLGKAQVELAKDKTLAPMKAIKSAGTMPDDEHSVDKWWDNELHPTMAGFKLLVKTAFAPELRKINLV